LFFRCLFSVQEETGSKNLESTKLNIFRSLTTDPKSLGFGGRLEKLAQKFHKKNE